MCLGGGVGKDLSFSVVLLIVRLVVLVTTPNRGLVLFAMVVGMPVLGWSRYDLAKSRSLRERQERDSGAVARGDRDAARPLRTRPRGWL